MNALISNGQEGGKNYKEKLKTFMFLSNNMFDILKRASSWSGSLAGIQYFMAQSHLLALRSTCTRLTVGQQVVSQ